MFHGSNACMDREKEMSDLISREALKKATKELYNETLDGIVKFGIEKVYELINNAPAVEIATKLQPNCNKLQGEWIISQTMDCHSDIINIYTCPFCGKREYAAYPFCHCGAELKGGAE